MHSFYVLLLRTGAVLFEYVDSMIYSNYNNKKNSVTRYVFYDVNVWFTYLPEGIQVLLIPIQYLLPCKPSSTYFLRLYFLDYNTNLCQRLKSIPTTLVSSVTVVFIDATAIQTTHNQSSSTHLKQLVKDLSNLTKLEHSTFLPIVFFVFSYNY